MDMVARTRIVIDVPFDFATQEPDETGHAPSRVAAAQHAENEVASKIRNLLAGYGQVVDVLIEEVRDAS